LGIAEICIMALKQVILVRTDLKLPKGKLAAQVAHASLEAALKSSRQVVDEWRADGGKKVVLKVDSQAELGKFKQMAEKEKLTTALIADAGHTVLEPGTVTCLGIGPDKEEKIDRVTGSLKIL
jgi:peptidyl-tRNA hydrolase, PTH2 family